MSYTSLTDILDSVINDLRDQRIKTIEIRSAHNLFSVLNMNVGDKIFLTSATPQDITCGTKGLIAKVIGLHTMMHRVYHGTEQFYEEREALVARIQLQLHGFGRVKSVEEIKLGKPTIVEADDVLYYEAR
ncbi:MAG: DUF473 domain-containing protein [Halobacteriota archaeon]|nr:DUF473 domain-containing protein [Halobacteriota archaeon]